VMLGFFGAGAIAGSVVAPWVQRRIHPKVVMIGAFWLWAFGALLSAFIDNPYGLGAVWAVGGAFGPIFNVSFAAYRYALVPDRLLARVGSVALVIAWGAIPLGQISAGGLLQGLGARDTILLLAGLMAVVGAAATASRAIRTVPRVEELVSEQSAQPARAV
jgi:MFS family permease